MSTRYDELDSAEPPRRSILWLALLALVAFVTGLALMLWVLSRWPAAADMMGVRSPAPPSVPAAAIVAPEPVQTPNVIAVPTQDVELNRRVAELEQRIGAIDTKTREAVGNADRAESLLIAFAARRALDRGVGLGYLEALLRQRFGASQPQAVATIIAASNKPITLQELQQQLQELGPDLVTGSPKQSWWSALKQELGDLVTVRHSETPSTMPSERLARAQQRLEAGQVNIALAELNRLPGRDKAAAWFGEARRYIAARDALDRIETAALLDQRTQPAQASVAAALASPSASPAARQ